jgi:hypothetical protein
MRVLSARKEICAAIDVGGFGKIALLGELMEDPENKDRR